MIKYILTFLIVSYTSISSINEETFQRSLENYCQYCLSTMSSEELELLAILSDEKGILCFNIYIGAYTFQVPFYVKDLFKEPDILEIALTKNLLFFAYLKIPVSLSNCSEKRNNSETKPLQLSDLSDDYDDMSEQNICYDVEI